MEHIYKPSEDSCVRMLKGAALLLGGAIFGAFVSRQYAMSVLIIGFIIFKFATYLTENVHVSSDSIERSALFSKRRCLMLSDIAGWRVVWNNSKGGSYYTLEILPKDTCSNKPLKISQNIQIDENFKNWLTQFPNQTDAANTRFGMTPEEATQRYFQQSD